MTLNEEVARALGFTELERVEARDPDGVYRYLPDFEHDWNAVYRWIVPAVKEMGAGDRELFVEEMMALVIERTGEDWPDFLDATPEDYCRAFLKVKAS